MKIIVVENNYISDDKTNGNIPYFYLKPDVSIIRNNQPVYYPLSPQSLYLSLNLVIKINRLGKTVIKKFSHRYFNELTVGANFFITSKNKKNIHGHDSIENVTLFDNSLQLGKLVEKNIFPDLNNLNCSLFVNDKLVVNNNINNLILKTDELISFVSKYLTIKMGDFILTAFPYEIDEFKQGDRIKASIENHILLDFMVK